MTTQPAEVQERERVGIGMRLFARYVESFLGKSGAIRIVDANGASVDIGEGRPQFEVKFADRGIIWEVLRNPTLGFGEGYMNKRIVLAKGTLFDLLDMLFRALTESEAGKPSLRQTMRRQALSLLRANNRIRARHNVEYHYDSKNELWDLFMDSYRQYTCGYFPAGVQAIDDAQIRKMDHIARKLVLRPGLRVLDIGSGWGGLAVHLAKNYDVRVEGITLSKDQLEFASSYAAENGVSDLASFRIQDYRSLNESYDRIVAVGMLEHVGAKFYPKYFETIRNNLTEDGVALIHAIGRPTGPFATEPFMDKYIFPGSHAPSLSEVAGPIEQSGLYLTDLEIWRLHYVHTLRAWREKFYRNWKRAEELYGDTFCRMWEFYLASCEVAFKCGVLQVFQFQLSKRFGDVPITRDYQLSPAT